MGYWYYHRRSGTIFKCWIVLGMIWKPRSCCATSANQMKNNRGFTATISSCAKSTARLCDCPARRIQNDALGSNRGNDCARYTRGC